ncbi:MAG: (deoxy)nucleoside triphosphate pyrophosphohydrolase [Alphaproteobacteria bacterium]|nr:(deoxy)nucleoside triphosphate pyrophosphohydrolase [Alphaproteobacteria bacterium]
MNSACEQQKLPLTTKQIKLVVAVALIDADGRVLINERPIGKALSGYWEFPGGKIETGETPEAALLRELHEELNITTSLGCFAPIAFASHSYDDFHLLMPLYICHLWHGDIMARENQKLRWVKGVELYRYKMLPADIPLIPLLLEWL